MRLPSTQPSKKGSELHHPKNNPVDVYTYAHELRNEVTEELISDMGMKIVEDGAVRSEETREPEGEPMERAKEERNGGAPGKRGHRVPLGEASVRGKETAVSSQERRSSCC